MILSVDNHDHRKQYSKSRSYNQIVSYRLAINEHAWDALREREYIGNFMGLAWKTNTYSWRFESEIALLVHSLEPVFFFFLSFFFFIGNGKLVAGERKLKIGEMLEMFLNIWNLRVVRNFIYGRISIILFFLCDFYNTCNIMRLRNA